MGSHVALLNTFQELLDERPVAELEGLKAWTVEKKRVGSLIGDPGVPDHHSVEGLAQLRVRLRVQTQEMSNSKVSHTHRLPQVYRFKSPASETENLQHRIVSSLPEDQGTKVHETPEDTFCQVTLLNGDLWTVEHLDLCLSQLVPMGGAQVVEEV